MKTARALQMAAVAVAAGALVLVPATAFAAGIAATASGSASATTGTGQSSDPVCSPSQFATAQQKVETDLANRVTRLNALLAQVQSPGSHLSSSDQAALVSDISGVELPGIQALQPEVQQATTCAELWKYAHEMVYDYRVYVVMTPQTHETITADDETYVDGQITSLEPTVEQAIAWAKAHGRDVSGADEAFTDLQNQCNAASTAISGTSATLLAQTPAGYPGNASVFVVAHTQETAARNDLKAAYADLSQIFRDLR